MVDRDLAKFFEVALNGYVAFVPAGLGGVSVLGYRPPRMGRGDGNAVYRVQLGGGRRAA
ncbi:MAG: hypothetical protein JO110_02205 [Acetobacteraceae bacterium]|nr:hypothetical protein [Acetobacteraceae bacterium]